jgi:hypothetical protein
VALAVTVPVLTSVLLSVPWADQVALPPSLRARLDRPKLP